MKSKGMRVVWTYCPKKTIGVRQECEKASSIHMFIKVPIFVTWLFGTTHQSFVYLEVVKNKMYDVILTSNWIQNRQKISLTWCRFHQGTCDILRNNLSGEYADNSPFSWIFQQDNYLKHCSKIVKSWINQEGINVWNGHRRVPILTLLSLWGILKRVVAKKTRK